MSANDPAGTDTGTGWLDALEERVRQAAERLRELGAENDRLRAEVTRLEAELEAATAARAGRSPDAAVAAEAEAWREERAEVRRRVEGLVERLGDLLSL